MEKRNDHGLGPVDNQPGAHTPHAVHLPGPSYWPLVLSACLFVLAMGVIFQPVIAIVAAIVGLISIIAWGLEG